MRESPESWLHQPLAIIGMDCRLPGADGLEQFWQLLVQGGYAVQKMSDAKLDRRLYYDSRKGQRGKTYSEVGGFVDERDLDWSILNIRREEASKWDACHLNLCEVAARACRNAGFDPLNLPSRKIGVFVGHSGGTTLGGDLAYRAMLDEYIDLLTRLPSFQELGGANRGYPESDGTELLRRLQQELYGKLSEGRPHRAGAAPFVDAGFASGLISRNFGLTGPHISVDAACASSLVALAIGAMSLASGHSDMAIVGGASYNKTDSLILFSAAQSCSADRSRPFDQNADGLISSEGYVAVIIKQLHRAVADGNNIQAVIRGIGISSDGRGRSLWAPRHEGQMAAIRRAYGPGVSPASVQMIEAHATSTQVGDATEMEALAGFYEPLIPKGQHIAVGSIKSNIGHTLETAGLAGLLKTVLSMQHGIIPPSINIQHLNESIPWHKIPFKIPMQATVWPDRQARANSHRNDGSSFPGRTHIGSSAPEPLRRAAVNAFGIGGLNVHVVVDNQIDLSLSRVEAASPQVCISMPEPIAVVGRGLVVPGANCLADYMKLIGTNATPTKPGHVRERSLKDCVHQVSYEYDWRRHKVPPKQVAHANPLQFMLLEAAEQALGEAGLLDNSIHREQTAVVVGSIFGGDFGNSLFAGLRLPEWRDRLIDTLQSARVPREKCEKVADDYERRFLEQYPALLDETGSFTSSTLASRIAKTFNLMGGAMAVDAGDVSGLAALKTGCWLLQSGAVQTVLCAAAQRALDRAALENLVYCGRLRTDCMPADGMPTNNPIGLTPQSNYEPEMPTETQGYEVGEGVVLLVLQRLSQARRDGIPVLATIDSVSLGCAADQLSQSVRNSLSTLESGSPTTLGNVVGRLGIQHLDDQVLRVIHSMEAPPGNSNAIASNKNSSSVYSSPEFKQPTNLEITGHLQCTQGLLDIVNVSLQADSEPSWIIGHTLSGQSGVVQVSVPCKSQSIVACDELSELEINCWTSDSTEDLKHQLATGLPSMPMIDASRRFAAAVVSTKQELRTKSRKLASVLGSQKAAASLTDQGMIWLDRHDISSSKPKIAFVFSGQGSQYPQMFRSLADRFLVARQFIDHADSILDAMGQPGFADMAWAVDNQLGENVWHTQASLLVADSMVAEVLSTLGIRPDIVCGHSYGEIPAMLAAGCLDLEAALNLTWHRCRCVTDFAPSGCSMMSIQADEQTVNSVIAKSQLPVTISHINTPTQTVVGGKSAHVAHLAGLLEELQIVSRILPVPTAFHTPILQPSVGPYREALDLLPINPPRIPLLSSVSNRFMADPEWIRDGLADQLITPLRFVDLIARLEQVGVTHLIEVGPQRILTRLARSCSNTLQVLATDTGVSTDESWRLPISTLQAWAHLLGLTIQTIDRTSVSSRAISVLNSNLGKAKSSRQNDPVKHFDATQVRKQRNRQQSVHRPGEFQDRNVPPVHITTSDSSIAPATDAQETLIANSSQIERLLVDFVVEQTGYPAEIVELEADLEADLGIDSIKKAQLLGELRELFPQTIAKLRADEKDASRAGRTGGQRLAELRTLRDFVRLLSPERDIGTDDRATSQSVLEQPISFQSEVATRAQNSVAAPLPAASKVTSVDSNSVGQHVSYQGLAQFVVNFVVEQTGYPAEIVELDADLEADLGIDSIKKAQLLGELRETFGLSLPKSSHSQSGRSSAQLAQPAGRVQLDKLRTLRQILSLLADQLGIQLSVDGENPGPHASVAEVPSLKQEQVDAQQEDSELGKRVAVDLISESPSIAVSETLFRDNQSQSLALNRVPVADSSLCGIPILSSNYRNGFLDAMKKNLRAFPTRRNQLVSLSADSAAIDHGLKGSVATVNAKLGHLVQQANLSEVLLSSFDEQVTSESSWEIIEPGTRDSRAVNSLHWFAQLRLPTWLAANPCQPIGIVEQTESQTRELLIPGCTSSLAMVNRHGLIIIAGATNHSVKRQLSVRLHELQAIQWLDLSEVIERWTDLDDWWILTAEPANGTLIVYKHFDATISKTSDVLTHWRSEQESSSVACARIGWNSQLQNWTVAAQAGPLVEPVVQSLDITTLISTSVPDHIARNSLSSKTHLMHSPENSFFSGFSSVDLRTVDDQSCSHDELLVEKSEATVNSNIAQRYVLRMMPAPQLDIAINQNAGTACQTAHEPEWSGAAVVVGDNPVATHLESRLKSRGVVVFRPQLSVTGGEMELQNWFVELSSSNKLPHLFITSPCDAEAQINLNAGAWQRRRQQGLMSVYWLCQKWIEHIAHHHLEDDASLIALSTLGGDFGLSGQLYSAEGGGINGLLKSMLIECWMQGIRTLPIKTIDVAPDQAPNSIVDCIWQELAVPSYDNEISYRGGIRRIVKAIPQSLVAHRERGRLNGNPTGITRGGTWICTGGARGITALAVEKLAARYDLAVHLIGTAPAPNTFVDGRSYVNSDDSFVGLSADAEGLRQLKLKIMKQAQHSGRNPVKAWQDYEKQLEIQTTIRRFRQQGIRAHYHSCDVADRQHLCALLDSIRQSSGPIRGVIHGAGVGRDSRFDRKQPEKVQQCIAAKVDGTLSLMAATWDDPLEVFVGFGSISGRFGANGHTDYSLANDMMCKLIDWLRCQRPTVRAIGFHWHAWGDVGMATKPETKLALEMINMQFMPAEEGVRHLIDELESDQADSEVLITDDRYYRAFYPAETLVQDTNGGSGRTTLPKTPLLAAPHMVDSSLVVQPNTRHFIATVHPAKDPFLAEHLLDGIPLLPFVIATEMMAEAALAGLGTSALLLRDVRAHSPIKFYTESQQDLHLFCTKITDVDSRTIHGPVSHHQAPPCQIVKAQIELRSDFVSQRGVIVDRQRLNFSAQALFDRLKPDSSANVMGQHDPTATIQVEKMVPAGATKLAVPKSADWRKVVYPELDSEFYVGWPLQKLRKFALLNEGLVGRISAPAFIELAGVTRSTDGWIIPSAALDACLFAAGILAWNRIAPGSALPVQMGQLRMGRLPRPGEACTVHVVINSVAPASASFNFSMYGGDGALILDCVDYQVAWLSRDNPELDRANFVDSGLPA